MIHTHTDPTDDLTTLDTVALVERYQDAPDECTIFPDVRKRPDMTTTEWISAKEGSFVSRAFVR